MKTISGTLVVNETNSVKLQRHSGFCDGSSFKLVGNFSSKRLDVLKPVVRVMIDDKNIPLRWVFYKVKNDKEKFFKNIDLL